MKIFIKRKLKLQFCMLIQVAIIYLQILHNY